MAKNVYALLVGIDNYESPIPPLRGCTNDIQNFHQLLQTRTATGECMLQALTLLDSQATRENIILGFRNHLSKAKAGDVALFYYSGHGSQEDAAEEYWQVEPDHLNETLVTYDSRRKDAKGNDVYDLADKELAQLISEVADNKPHLLVVLDCCHSGSATRAADGSIEEEGVRVRRAPIDHRKRPLESYILSKAQIATLTREINPSDWVGSGGGKHVLMAGCRSDQTSKEARIGGQQRGAFSAALMDALEQPGSLSYRDLFKRVENQIKNTVMDQNPQLELLSGQLDELFLGGAVPERPPYFTLRFESNNGWTLDAGVIHGLLASTKLAVFAAGSDPALLLDPSKGLGSAEVSTVQAGKSLVGLEFANGQPDQKATYWAVVTGFPVQPLEVQLGDGEAYAAVRDALKQSLLVAEHAEGAKYRVLARNGAYWITLPGSERPLTSELDIAEPANVDKLVKRLEAMARWRNIKDLGNPTSQIAGQIKMQVLGEDGKLLESSVRLSQLKAAAGEPILPAIRVRLTNQSNKKLFCTLLCLSESFAVDALVEGNNKVQPLEAGETVELNRGEPMLFELPDELWKLGITERTDVLKLVVSSEDFDANLLEQAKLDFPTRSGATRGLDEGNPLQQLMRRVATRDPVKKSDKYADWCTQTFALTIVRPPENAIISPSQPAEVGVEGARIRVKPHPQLKAKVGMATKAQAIRSVEGLNVPPILRDNPGLVQPLQFSTTRGSGGALEVFELTDIANPESVTPEHPLELELPISFDPSTEQIIPLAIHKDEHGTEYYLPLGFAEPAATRAVGDGATVKLEYLPNLPEVSTEERTRSLFNSLRMMFLKVVGDKFGIKVANQTLSAVEVSAEGTAKYVKDPAEVKRRVEALQAGQKVLLYVHGILGETKDIVGTVVSTPSGLTQPISQHYPLILAYDYENLNTSIKESGRLLREKLIEVGLGPNHGKNLNIVAHSMGGLVARWFIEHQGGGSDQMVKRLVMLGTPNGGSPWLNLKDWVTHMLTLAVNGLAPAAWVATILNGAVLLLRATTTTSEMKLNSPFIQELGSNLAEGVKYAFIAGDASLQGGKERQGFVGQLLNLTLHGASKQLFQGKPNDLAASVDSVLSPVSGERPAPIPSDHFSYFVPEVGLGSLVKELEG